MEGPLPLKRFSKSQMGSTSQWMPWGHFSHVTVVSGLSALTLALTAHAKTNVNPSLPAQVPACGREFIIPDSESQMQVAFCAAVRKGSGKCLVPRQKSQCWVWDRVSRFVGGFFPGDLDNCLVGAVKKVFSLLPTIYSVFPIFQFLLQNLWKIPKLMNINSSIVYISSLSAT